MHDAPRQLWSLYESRMNEIDRDWFRSLSPGDRFDFCASIFNSYWIARQNMLGDWDQFDREQWQDKVAIRLRMVETFRKLDEYRQKQSPQQ